MKQELVIFIISSFWKNCTLKGLQLIVWKMEHCIWLKEILHNMYFHQLFPMHLSICYEVITVLEHWSFNVYLAFGSSPKLYKRDVSLSQLCIWLLIKNASWFNTQTKSQQVLAIIFQFEILVRNIKLPTSGLYNLLVFSSYQSLSQKPLALLTMW